MKLKNKIEQLIERLEAFVRRNWIAIVALAGLFFIPLNVVGAPISGRKLVLDLQFIGYSAEGAYQILTALGPDGRYRHWATWALDIGWSGVHPLLFLLILSRLLEARKLYEAWWQSLLILPLFVGVIDWLENVGIALQLQSYPDWSSSIQIVSSLTGLLLTPLKWLLSGLILVAMIGLILWALAIRLLKLRHSRA